MKESPSNALHCLSAIGRRHGVEFSAVALAAEFGSERLTLAEIAQAAKHMGLEASADRLTPGALLSAGPVFPLLAITREGDAFIIAGVARASDDNTKLQTAAILRPPQSTIEQLNPEALEELWSGEVLYLKRRGSPDEEREQFGMRWFLPEILRHKVLFRDIGVATLALGLVGLGTPIFTQQVIDKVMVHQNMSTLVVLTVAVTVLILFEAIFTYIRTYLLNAGTRKIDLKMSRDTFGHLVSLPIEHFEKRAAGVIVRQMQQVGVIRNFLTGSIFFTALECVMFVIFLPILMLYSVTLTLIVLAISLLMAAITYALIGPFRTRLEKLATVESVRQAMLVESIHGMRTVKALANEIGQKKLWDERSAKTMDLLFDVMQISNIAQFLTLILQRLMIVAIMVAGSFLVIEQEISLGTLIGFQMLSARVTGPLAMLVGLIHEYQQVKVSLNMLADVMDSDPELRAKSGIRPRIDGRITFEQVTFRYPSSSVNALDRLNIDIKVGEMVGIVGKSGSGKSTLAKLLQALYLPQEGVIRVDGTDIREIETSHLRKQVGVVLQDSFLFRGTVRENIAAGRPSATIEEIIQSAKASGAAEFIEKLPQSYDTLIEENASNLSGGQRQRIAIARSLIGRPRVLIFDEATSALDPESETIVMQNLNEIAKGRTVLLISHRLATLVSCDRIMFLEQGRLINVAPHQSLLEICPQYRSLWLQQNRFLTE